MEYVWGVMAVADIDYLEEDLFVALPRASAEDIAGVLTLVNECTTWGEVRERATNEQFADLLMGSGREDEPPPDATPFRPWDEIGWLIDGDYPSDPRFVMNLEVPGDLIDAHGVRYNTVHNGEYAEFPAAVAQPVLAELGRRGHTCTHEPDLVRGTFL